MLKRCRLGQTDLIILFFSGNLNISFGINSFASKLKNTNYPHILIQSSHIILSAPQFNAKAIHVHPISYEYRKNIEDTIWLKANIKCNC